MLIRRTDSPSTRARPYVHIHCLENRTLLSLVTFHFHLPTVELTLRTRRLRHRRRIGLLAPRSTFISGDVIYLLHFTIRLVSSRLSHCVNNAHLSFPVNCSTIFEGSAVISLRPLHWLGTLAPPHARPIPFLGSRCCWELPSAK